MVDSSKSANPPLAKSSHRQIRERLLAEKESELRDLQDLQVSEVTPSRRDFAQFVATQKRGIATIPRLKRRDPLTGRTWPQADLVGLARAFDASDAAAVAVCTALPYGGSAADLRAVAEAVGLAVLRDDLCLHANHVYQARLHGADAVILPAAHLAAEPLAELARIARSMHMMPVIEVTRPEDVPIALALAPACIGLTCLDADGFADSEQVRRLAEAIPRQRTLLLLSEPRSLELLRALDGVIDAAVIGDVLLDAPDPAALIDPP